MLSLKNKLLFLSLFVSLSCFYAQGKGKSPEKKVGIISELEQMYLLKQLPAYRSGIIEQESSYDRTGKNDDGFSGKYSYIRKEGDQLVLADWKGPGVINRIWTPTPTTDTIKFYIDGEKKPRISIPFIDLFSGKVYPFINPICGNEVGGYYCYLPIPYQKSCKVVYTGKKMEFYQIQSRLLPEKTIVKPFSMILDDSENRVLDKVCEYWQIQTDPLRQTEKFGPIVRSESKQFFISPGESVPFFTDDRGGRIVGIEIEAGTSFYGDKKDILFQACWDGDNVMAINCPVADYFGYAFGKPSVRSILLGSYNDVNYSYLPMPYRKKAQLKLTYEKRSEEQPKIEVKTKVYYSDDSRTEGEGALYTIWRREIDPEEYKPYLLSQIMGKGHLVGVLHQAQALKPGMTLFFEGDDITVADGKMRTHGTGSEDFYNGGWYALLDRWDRGVSLPIHGSMDYSLPMARTGGYRFFLSDKMSFEQDFLQTIEHGPEDNKYPVDYTSLTFYYGDRPAPRCTTDPVEELRTVNHLKEHIFYPQLMNITLGGNTQIENRGRFVVSAQGEGSVRIMLDELPEGIYKIMLTYYETPEGGEFSVWNRQKMISDWKSAYSPQEKVCLKQYIGEFSLTKHTNSVTIKIRNTDKGKKFHFENLFLEKI